MSRMLIFNLICMLIFFWREKNLQFGLGLFGSSVTASTKKVEKQGDRIGDSVLGKSKWGDRIPNSVFMVFEKKKTNHTALLNLI